MRIVQVAPFFHPHAGGVESHVRAISAELVRQGHDVTVVTSAHDRRLPLRDELDGVHVVRFPTSAVVYNTPIAAGVGRLVREVASGADVAHLHFPPPVTAYSASRALRRSGVPTCLTYHCDLYLPGVLGRILTGIYGRVFLPPTLDRVGRVIVHTRSYGATSAPLRGRDLAIIPSSVDVQRFRPDLDAGPLRAKLGLDGHRVIAFAGRLVPHKGVDGVLRILPELPNDVDFVVIGRGPRLPVLRGLARRLGVEDRVRFLTEVTDDELPTHLRMADLFVFPSQNRLEGFGLVVAEALATGLPVVIADMPGVREVIEPGREGLLVEPMIAGDLGARVRELLDDPERRRRMSTAARRRAEERYALPKVARELTDVYSTLRAAG
ncbi:MAG TPA: glycosyltransferase family 4 protein [Thermoplasmata archaeon]|nr:glycosyltransferase family 4 protein [Thermoplasmata archaeon]